MSNYIKNTKHPVTGEWLPGYWIDDHFGPHHYGVTFDFRAYFDPDKIDIETNDEPHNAEWPTTDTPEDKPPMLCAVDGFETTDASTMDVHYQLSHPEGSIDWTGLHTGKYSTAPTNRDSRSDHTTLSAIVKEYTGHSRQDLISAIMAWHEDVKQTPSELNKSDRDVKQQPTTAVPGEGELRKQIAGIELYTTDGIAINFIHPEHLDAIVAIFHKYTERAVVDGQTDFLEYLSEQAIEYSITNAEVFAHRTGYDGQMLIPLKAVSELQATLSGKDTSE
jgi:hypothetical protein